MICIYCSGFCGRKRIKAEDKVVVTLFGKIAKKYCINCKTIECYETFLKENLIVSNMIFKELIKMGYTAISEPLSI
jgi:hypothetical protein